jgi:uncharacterized repeat protein (TIGR01451 family)
MNQAPDHIATKILIAIAGALALGLTLLLPLMAASQPSSANPHGESRQPDISQPALPWDTRPAANLPALRPPATALSVVKLVATDSAADGALVRNGDTITYSIVITNMTSQSISIDQVRDVLPPSALLNPHCLDSSGTVPDTHCTLENTDVAFPVISGPITDAEKIVISDTLVSSAEAITWGNFTLPPNETVILQFAATLGCQPDGATIQNQADVLFAGGNGFASSTKTTTLVEFKPGQSGSGEPLFTGPSWCSTEQGGVFDQDWADYDLDGDLDLALATINGPVVYTNDGGGTFARKIISGVHNAFGARWADLEGDQRLELIVVGDYFTTTTGVYKGRNYVYTPANNFDNPQITFETDDILWRVDLADADGNGKLEMAAATYFGYLGYPYPTALRHKYNLCLLRLYNYDDASGGFAPGDCLIGPLTRREIMTLGDPQDDTYSVAWGDVDGDGDLDLVEGRDQKLNRWYENKNGALSAASHTINDGLNPIHRTRSIALGDYDRDGRLDVAEANENETNHIYGYTGANWVDKWATTTPDPSQAVAWGNSGPIPAWDSSIPVADDQYVEYELPFVFDFFGRNIIKIGVNTNGMIELLEAGESCRACGYFANTHASNIHVSQNIDAIFALSADLYTGVIVEATPEDNPDRVEITWMGTTAADTNGYYRPIQYCTWFGCWTMWQFFPPVPNSFETRQNLFKVIMYRNGDVVWKFFDVKYQNVNYYPYGDDTFAGVYDEVSNVQIPLQISRPGYGLGSVPGGTQKARFRFTHSSYSSPIPNIGWDSWDNSSPAATDSHVEYSLPFTMTYFTRTIASLGINTNGLIQLFESGENCAISPVACDDKNTHTRAISQSIDAIYAANDDLKTWVFVEGDSDRTTITWMGTTSADDASDSFSSGFKNRELAYKVILFPDGRAWWKFFDMKYVNHAGDLFSGAYAVAPPGGEFPVPGGTPSGYSLNARYQFMQSGGPPPTTASITPLIFEDLLLAVGNYGQANYLYHPRVPNPLIWSSQPSANNTTSLAWADYDGDGLADLAVGNYDQPNQIYIQTCTLTGCDLSGPAWTSTELDRTRSLAWGDLNGDGKPDLAVGSEGQSNRVYINSGGALATAWSAPTPEDTWSLAWADVDVDSDQDLAVGNYGQPNKIYRNDGGTLSDALLWEPSEAANTRSLAWGDYDEDGDPDLAVGNNGVSQLYLNQTFFRSDDGQIKRIGWIRDLSWADYDNDGDPDLAIGGIDLKSPGGGFMYVMKNENGLDFDYGSRLIPVAAGIGAELYDLAWGDYNRDGWLDLAGTFPSRQEVHIYKNQSGSSFAQELPPLENVTAFALDWVDLRADGWLDLVAADSPPKLYLNDSGFFGSPIVLDSLATGGTIFSLRGVDADGDGDLDLSLVNLAGQSLLYSAFGSFLNPELASVDNFAATGVSWGDHNGDGYLDLLFGGSSAGSRIYTNLAQAGPGFAFYKSLPGVGRRTAIFGDANGDGDLDIADGVIGGQVRLYLGDNDSASWSSNPDAYSLAWGDVNADGELDLLVGGSNMFLSPHQLFINQPGPLDLLDTGPSWASQEAEHTTGLAWGDYDNDNRLDFAAANTGQPTRIYRNQGDNTFSVTWSSPGGWDTRAVAWADYDGDGDLDLAIGNYNQPNYLYRNDEGTFNQAWYSEVSAATTALAWGDWDNNGRPDLAVGNDGQPDRVYANFSEPGTTHFLWLWQSAGAYHTTGLAWGDRDGDGDLDLAVSQADPAGPNGIYENGYVSPAHLDGFTDYMPTLDNPAYLRIDRPGHTDAAYAFSSSEILTGTTITTGSVGLTITYQVFDPDGTRSPLIINADGDELLSQYTSYDYSTDGGGKWQPATAALLPNPPTTTERQGQPGIFVWDLLADQVVNDDVRFRITIFDKPQPGTVQRIRTSAISPPFRVSSLTCQWPEGAWIKVVPDLVTYTVGSSIRFEGYVVAGSGHLTFTWNFSDDSALVNSQVLHHQFDAPGNYLVTLTVSGEPCPTTREVAASRGIVVSGPPVMTYTLYLPLIVGDGTASSPPPVSGLGLTVPGAPGQPTDLTGRIHAGGTTLEWAASRTTEQVLGYRVYRAPRSGGQPFRLLATLPATQTSYTDSHTICGQVYLITAYNQAGESMPSTSSYLNRACN